MTSSVDGRLLVDRWRPQATGIETDFVHGLYAETVARLGAESWIVSRTTMAELATDRHR